MSYVRYFSNKAVSAVKAKVSQGGIRLRERQLPGGEVKLSSGRSSHASSRSMFRIIIKYFAYVLSSRI
jgi:hypothetical protein